MRRNGCSARASAAALACLLLAAAAASAADTPPPGPGSPEVEACPPPLPVEIPEEKWQPLRGTVDPLLQADLEARLRSEPSWWNLVGQGRMALGLVDLTRPDSPRFARLKGDRMFYAASLPKIALLLAAVQSFEDGTLAETPEVLADLERMIRYSDNPAATRILDRLGHERVASVLTNPRYRLYDARRGGGLWVGKRYAAEGKRRPDPLNGVSHGATVTQVCRFYYLLATGRLVSPERSAQMLEILSQPGLHHKFVRTLESRAPRASLYRKSGTWRSWHCDSALVWGPEWRRYILVALIEDAEGERILRELVPAVEEVLHGKPGPSR